MSRRKTSPSPIVALERIRLDKWLWAARFFRTRAQAKQAIEKGKVERDGIKKPRPASGIIPGMVLKIQQGFDQREIIVQALSDRRQAAPEAQLLYEETSVSLAARESTASQRRLQRAAWYAGNKPDKKERRKRLQLKHGSHGAD